MVSKNIDVKRYNINIISRQDQILNTFLYVSIWFFSIYLKVKVNAKN